MLTQEHIVGKNLFEQVVLYVQIYEFIWSYSEKAIFRVEMIYPIWSDLPAHRVKIRDHSTNASEIMLVNKFSTA